MPQKDTDQISRLMTRTREGDANARSELWSVVYEELRALAERKMARQPFGSLQPTALVHETYLRLLGDHRALEGRLPFYRAAAEAMRRILIDRARSAGRLRRGGAWKRIPLEGLEVQANMDGDQMLALDAALERLSQESRELYDVVMLRYFAGLTIEQTGETLGSSPSTVDREWRCARLWLYDWIRNHEDPSP